MEVGSGSSIRRRAWQSGPGQRAEPSVKIIHRYVLREHIGPFWFAFAALTSLLLLNYFAKQFGNLVGKGIPARIIAEFLLLALPFTVAMTVPMSVLIATLYAFSRLAGDNEVTALKGSGVSTRRLLVPVLLVAAVISAGMLAFNDQVLAAANHRLRTLRGDIARKKPTFGLREQIINEVVPNRFFLRATHLEPYSNRMRDVTIYDLSDPLRSRTIYAERGEVAFAPNGTDLVLTLHNGTLMEVPREQPLQLQQLHFVTDYILVRGVANQLEMTRDPTIKTDREMTICELQNEVSRYELEYEQARSDLEKAMLAAVREALTGIPATPPQMSSSTVLNVVPGAPAPRSKHFSLGRLYCDGVALIKKLRGGSSLGALKVPPLYAAELVPGTSIAVPQQVARQEGGTPQETAVPTVTPPAWQQSYGTAPQLPFLVTGYIESARARSVQHREQVNLNAVELHKKFAISLACVVFVLVGAPIALRFPRGGVGLVIGASMTIFGLYYIGLIAGEALADRAILSPFWAMWSANVALVTVGAILLPTMDRESATAQGGDIQELAYIVGTALRLRRRNVTKRSRGR